MVAVEQTTSHNGPIFFVDISPNVTVSLSAGGWWAIGWQTNVPAVATVYYGPAKDPPQYLYKMEEFVREYTIDHLVSVQANEGAVYDVKLVCYDKSGNPAIHAFRAQAVGIEGGGGAPTYPPGGDPGEVLTYGPGGVITWEPIPPPVSEVEAAAVDPYVTNAASVSEVWYDTSPSTLTPPQPNVLYIRVNGVWEAVPTAATSEVEVADVDPYVTTPTSVAEMWYDTSPSTLVPPQTNVLRVRVAGAWQTVVFNEFQISDTEPTEATVELWLHTVP